MKKLVVLAFIGVAIVIGCGKKITPGSDANIQIKNTNDKTEKSATQTADQNNAATSPASFNNMKGTIPPPVESQKIVSLENGKKVYVAKCGTCHSLKNPGDYTEKQLHSILQVEIPKAKLDKTEADQVTSYMLSNAKR